MRYAFVETDTNGKAITCYIFSEREDAIQHALDCIQAAQKAYHITMNVADIRKELEEYGYVSVVDFAYNVIESFNLVD